MLSTEYNAIHKFNTSMMLLEIKQHYADMIELEYETDVNFGEFYDYYFYNCSPQQLKNIEKNYRGSKDYNCVLKQFDNYIELWKYSNEVAEVDEDEFCMWMLHSVDPLSDYEDPTQLHWKSKFEVKLFNQIQYS